MEPWEYRIEVIKTPELRSITSTLNRLGAEGWELVSTVSTVKTLINVTGNDLGFLFKRPGLGAFETPEAVPY